MNAKEKERAEAVAQLRKWLKPGDTVYTILRRVSRSGMQREIGIVLMKPDGADGVYAGGAGLVDLHPNYLAAKALGERTGKRDGIIVDGCGMDMGFHLVYSLSSVLFRDGFGCIGERCPSNDHSNGDRDYTPHAIQYTAETCPGKPCSSDCDHKSGPGREHWHKSGGYALKHRWL